MKKRGTVFTFGNKKLISHAVSLEKKQRIELIRIYIASVILGIVPFTLGALTQPIFQQPLFVFIFPAVTASAWYGNIKSGILTTVVAVLGISYIYFILSRPILYPFSLAELGIVVLGSLLVSFVLDKCKKTNEIKTFKQREKKYADLLIQLDKEYTKAKEEIKARDEFLSIATHELKTPLTSMLLQLQKALHNIRNVSLANFSVQSLMRMIESAEGQSKRLAEMINDLLNVSLITTGRLNLSPEKFNLSDVVVEVKKRFAEEIKRQHYTIRFAAKEVVVGKWDRVRIEQIVTNLLTNAIKYGNKKPIEITVQKHGSYARFCVKDHGIGIPNDKQKKIFERFERAVSAEYKGLGVGLYITSQIVKAHGGKIKVDSSPGRGSTFTVDLPIKK